MSIAISVRRATRHDVPDITALVNRAYEVERFFVDGPRTDEAEIAELLEAGDFLVLEDGDHPLAATVFVRCENNHAYIGMLSVHPDVQGSGLGKRLVRIAEALGEARGARFVALRVVNLREDLARWYKSLGYCEVGTSPYAGTAKQPCHFVEMRRVLEVPSGSHPAGKSAAAAFA